MSKNIFIKNNFIKFFVFLSLFSLSFISFSFAQNKTAGQACKLVAGDNSECITGYYCKSNSGSTAVGEAGICTAQTQVRGQTQTYSGSQFILEFINSSISDTGKVITNFNSSILGNGVALLSGLAVVAFLWGLVLFISHRQSAQDQKLKQDKEMMYWGLVALFVLVSLWGIIKLVQGFFGISSDNNINIPRICLNGNCNPGSGNPGTGGISGGSSTSNDFQNKLITGDYDASKVALWKIDNNFKNNKTWVAQLQKFLTVQGYNLGVTGPNKDGVDGDFGTKTTEALKDFQRKNKLVDDGIVGESTKAVILYRYLNAPVTGDVYGTKNWSDISIGNGSAPDITNLQKLLIDLGCYYGNASGTFDKATEDGVKLFQQKNYLVQDGIVGPSTRAVFLSSGTYSCK